MKTPMLVLICALPATLHADGPARAAGPGFSMPVVAGYKLIDKALPGVAVGLVQEAPRPGWFRASIVVTPVNAALKQSDAQDAKQCALTGALMSKGTGATLKRAGIVDGPFGKTCQWEVSGERQAAVGTLMWGPRSWVVTCNKDPRDTDPTACVTALAGWRFDAAAK